MKKLIFTMIYTIPVVLLVFVLGRNLTLDDNTLLESQTQTKTYTKQEESAPKETSVIKDVQFLVITHYKIHLISFQYCH